MNIAVDTQMLWLTHFFLILLHPLTAHLLSFRDLFGVRSSNQSSLVSFDILNIDGLKLIISAICDNFSTFEFYRVAISKAAMIRI